MPRYALFPIPVLLFFAPAAAQEEEPPLAFADAARCGVLNSLMGVLAGNDAEQSRARNAMALTWFALAGSDASLDAAGQKAAFDRVHEEEGEAVVARPAEGTARYDHLLKRLTACDMLRRQHMGAYRDTAEFLAIADEKPFAGDVALGRQGREPPPIPQKDLTFGAWSFQSRGNNCIASIALAKDLTLALRFTNFSDGNIRLTGAKLPPIPEDRAEALAERHGRGASAGEDAEGNPVDRLDAGIGYAGFPGTAIFVDRQLAARFFFGLTEDGETEYRLGALQAYVWPKIRAGKTLQVKILGKEIGVIPLDAADGLWAEMQTCIDQYPDG